MYPKSGQDLMPGRLASFPSEWSRHVMSHGGALADSLASSCTVWRLRKKTFFCCWTWRTSNVARTSKRPLQMHSLEMCNGQTYPKTLMKKQKCNFPCKTTPKRIATYIYNIYICVCMYVCIYIYKGSTAHPMIFRTKIIIKHDIHRYWLIWLIESPIHLNVSQC